MIVAKSDCAKGKRQGRQNNHIKQVEKTNLNVVVPTGPTASNKPFAKELPKQRENIDKISAIAPSDVGY